MQSIVDLGGISFLDRMPPASRDQILLNSTRIRYPAGTIAFQPGGPDRADILENGFARLYLTSSEGRQTTMLEPPDHAVFDRRRRPDLRSAGSVGEFNRECAHLERVRNICNAAKHRNFAYSGPSGCHISSTCAARDR
jgi:hypothetical protein